MGCCCSEPPPPPPEEPDPREIGAAIAKEHIAVPGTIHGKNGLYYRKTDKLLCYYKVRDYDWDRDNNFTAGNYIAPLDGTKMDDDGYYYVKETNVVLKMKIVNKEYYYDDCELHEFEPVFVERKTSGFYKTPDGYIVYLQFKDNHYELNLEKHIEDEFDQIENSEWFLGNENKKPYQIVNNNNGWKMLDDDEEHSPYHYEFESPTFLGSHWLIDKDEHHHLFSLENHKYLENTSIKDPEGSFQYDIRMRKLTSLAGAMVDRPGKVCYLEFNVIEITGISPPYDCYSFHCDCHGSITVISDINIKDIRQEKIEYSFLEKQPISVTITLVKDDTNNEVGSFVFNVDEAWPEGSEEIEAQTDDIKMKIIYNVKEVDSKNEEIEYPNEISYGMRDSVLHLAFKEITNITNKDPNFSNGRMELLYQNITYESVFTIADGNVICGNSYLWHFKEDRRNFSMNIYNNENNELIGDIDVDFEDLVDGELHEVTRTVDESDITVTMTVQLLPKFTMEYMFYKSILCRISTGTVNLLQYNLFRFMLDSLHYTSDDPNEEVDNDDDEYDDDDDETETKFEDYGVEFQEICDLNNIINTRNDIGRIPIDYIITYCVRYEFVKKFGDILLNYMTYDDIISEFLYSPISKHFYNKYKKDSIPRKTFMMIDGRWESVVINYRDYISVLMYEWVFNERRATIEMFIETNIAWHRSELTYYRTRESRSKLRLFLESYKIDYVPTYYETIYAYLSRPVMFKQVKNNVSTVQDSDIIIAPCSGYYMAYQNMGKMKKYITSRYFYGRDLLGFSNEYYDDYKDSAVVVCRRSLDSGNTIYAPFECYISYVETFSGRYCNTHLTAIRHEQGHLMKSAKLAIEISSPNGSYSCLLLIISDMFSPDLNIITDQYRRAKSLMPGEPIAVGGSLVFMFFQMNRVRLSQNLIDCGAIPVETYLQGGSKIGTKLTYDYTLPGPKKDAKVPSAYKKFLLSNKTKEVVYMNNSIFLDPDENAPEIETLPVTNIDSRDSTSHITLLNPPNGAELFKRAISTLRYQLRNVKFVNVCIYKGEFNKAEQLDGIEPMQRYESFDTEKFNITQFVKYSEEGFYTVVLADHNDEIRAIRNYYITDREVPAYLDAGTTTRGMELNNNVRRSSYIAVASKNKPSALPDTVRNKRSRTQDFLARTMTSSDNRVAMIRSSTDYQEDLRRSMIDPRTGTPKALSSTVSPSSYKKSKH